MTLRLVIPLFLLGIAISGAARFKGACPQTPPTHRLPSSMESLNVIRSIPFSPGTQKHQYVFSFPEINSTHTEEVKVFFEKYSYQKEHILWITHNYIQPKVEVESVIFQLANQSEMILNSVVHRQEEKGRVELDCLPPFMETVKMWMEEYFLIIWTCAPDAKSGYHEEAVLLMTKNHSDMNDINGPTINQVMHNFRDFSTKFLSKELVKKIDWEPKYGQKTANWSNEFVCPRVYKAKRHYGVILGGYILVIGSLAAIFFGKVMGRNQVSPYVI